MSKIIDTISQESESKSKSKSEREREQITIEKSVNYKSTGNVIESEYGDGPIVIKNMLENDFSDDDDIVKPSEHEMSYEEYLRRKRPHVRPTGDDEDDNDWSYYRSDFD